MQDIIIKGDIIPPGVSVISRYKPFWKSASSDITSGRAHLDLNPVLGPDASDVVGAGDVSGDADVSFDEVKAKTLTEKDSGAVKNLPEVIECKRIGWVIGRVASFKFS